VQLAVQLAGQLAVQQAVQLAVHPSVHETKTDGLASNNVSSKKTVSFYKQISSRFRNFYRQPAVQMAAAREVLVALAL
jgi:hypothetical protein